MSQNATFEAALVVETKLMQAHALAESVCGGGGESFRALNDTLQDNLLWLLADTLKDALSAFSAMNSARAG